MKATIFRSALAALALGGILTSVTALPASASTTTTRNIVYGAAAAAAAFTLYNVEHKHQLATTVQGYLPDGSTVYRDGRVVSPNGYSWYPGNSGQTVACSNQYCSINGANNGYGYNNGYNNGYGYNSGGYTSGYGDNDGDEQQAQPQAYNQTYARHRGHRHGG